MFFIVTEILTQCYKENVEKTKICALKAETSIWAPALLLISYETLGKLF